MSDLPINGLNLTVDIKLDENGRPSVAPGDVVKFTQQLLFKAALDRTSNGTQVPVDMTELSMILRDMNQTALTTRKLDQEEEGLINQRAMVDAYAELRNLAHGKNLYTDEGKVTRQVDPYADVALPEVTLVDGELHQGELPLNPDDFLPD